MNVLEYEMLEILKTLKKDFGVFEIKAEYENEGSRDTELMRLKDVAEKANLPIILKIGGVEAVTDIYNALALGVKGIIAPMAETAFAASKFLNAINTFVPEDNRKDIEFALNIETITAYNNLEEILSLNNINILSSLTVGRVDFSASLGADRNFSNSDEMFKLCKTIFTKAKKASLKTALGGAISLESKNFVEKCIKEKLIDKFETRKLVYKNIETDLYDDAINLGIKFELLWLKSKRRYYHRIKDEDEKRISMLENRIKI
jgi:4-hydroxy-2-oxoheptanedioate aldolase